MMGYSKRLLLVSIPAALANLGVMVIWIEVAEGLTDVNKLLGDPLLPLLLAFSFAYLITALGLSLLILLVAPFLCRVSNPIVTKPAFVIFGGLLGGAAFAWSAYPFLFAACGAVSALICAIALPDLFRPTSRELAQDALAD
jgi:hypothetical protein